MSTHVIDITEPQSAVFQALWTSKHHALPEIVASFSHGLAEKKNPLNTDTPHINSWLKNSAEVMFPRFAKRLQWSIHSSLMSKPHPTTYNYS